MAEHSLSANPTHSRWNRALEPRLRIAPGDRVHMECVDSSGAQVRPGMSVEEYLRNFTRPISVLEEIRQAAKAKGLDGMTMRAINQEIKRYRRERRKKND